MRPSPEVQPPLLQPWSDWARWDMNDSWSWQAGWDLIIHPLFQFSNWSQTSKANAPRCHKCHNLIILLFSQCQVVTVVQCIFHLGLCKVTFLLFVRMWSTETMDIKKTKTKQHMGRWLPVFMQNPPRRARKIWFQTHPCHPIPCSIAIKKLKFECLWSYPKLSIV